MSQVVEGVGEGSYTPPFKILSIDGGGVGGVLPAKIVELMQTKLGIDIYQAFDLIVGTSTGSIIAAAIATRYDLTRLVKDYCDNAPKIFKKRWWNHELFTSKYNSTPLENFLHKSLGEIQLGDIQKPLIINATNASIGSPYVFKSAYQDRGKGDYCRDGEVPLYKSVLASCSAPSYFDPVDIDGTLICDGGIWANDPALVGYIDVTRNFPKSRDNVRILSLGTGQQIEKIYQPQRMWGLLTGWRGIELVEFLMSCQAKVPENALKLIDKDMIFRINPSIGDYKLDDFCSIRVLIERAKKEFYKNSPAILSFLSKN